MIYLNLKSKNIENNQYKLEVVIALYIHAILLSVALPCFTNEFS
jgi:Tfp pilus assembly protein PilE